MAMMCFALWHKLTDRIGAILTRGNPTCPFLHVVDAVNKKGYMKLLVRTVETNVVVVTIATLNRTMPDELWVAFGTWWAFPVHSNPRSGHSIVFTFRFITDE